VSHLPYDPLNDRRASQSSYAKRRARKTVNRKRWQVTQLPDGKAAGAERTSKRAVAKRYGS